MIDTSKEQPPIAYVPHDVFHRLLAFAENAAKHLTEQGAPPMMAPLTQHPALVESRAVAASLPPPHAVTTVIPPGAGPQPG